MSEAKGRLLLVDDNPENRDMLGRRLARRGFEITEAENGQVALEKMATENFDLVLLDIMMPVMDGIETLTRIRKTHSPADLGVIMATAKDQDDDLVEALKLGANDYITKPINFPVALARIETQLSVRRSVDTIRQLERDLAARNEALMQAVDELEESNEKMKRDLAAAARIQQALLPPRSLDSGPIRFEWHYQPCDELAGDILNIIPLDATHVGVFVVDVSGHGVPAALLSVAVSQMLSRTHGQDAVLRAGERIVPPAEVAMELARRFPPNASTHQYFTMLYGVMDTSSGVFRFTSAGHPGPVLVPHEGVPCILEASGFPIGMLAADHMPSPYDEIEVLLEPGDRLVFYSDGIPEAENPTEEPFGDDRLIQALEASRRAGLDESLSALVAEVATWSGTRFDDDISLVALERPAG